MTAPDNFGRRWGDGENVGSRLAVIEHQVEEFKSALESIRKLAARPSWPVVALLTGETAVIAALLARIKP